MIKFCEGFTKGTVIAIFVVGLIVVLAPYVNKYFNETAQIVEVKK